MNLETYSFDCHDRNDMAAFLTAQRLDGVTFVRSRWFWQPAFTVVAPAWRMLQLRQQIAALIDAEECSLAW